jgi:hypothetical protein
VFFGESLDSGVLLEVSIARVLDIVIERKHYLAGVGDLGGANRFEFRNDRARVIMGHHMGGSDRQVIAAMDFMAVFQIDREPLGDLFY